MKQTLQSQVASIFLYKEGMRMNQDYMLELKEKIMVENTEKEGNIERLMVYRDLMPNAITKKEKENE